MAISPGWAAGSTSLGGFMAGILVYFVSLIKCASKTNHFYKELHFGP